MRYVHISRRWQAHVEQTQSARIKLVGTAMHTAARRLVAYALALAAGVVIGAAGIYGLTNLF